MNSERLLKLFRFSTTSFKAASVHQRFDETACPASTLARPVAGRPKGIRYRKIRLTDDLARLGDALLAVNAVAQAFGLHDTHAAALELDPSLARERVQGVVHALARGADERR